MGKVEVLEVPYLAEDVHDLGGLFEINGHLFEQDGGGEAAKP